MTERKIHTDEIDWLITVYCTTSDNGLKSESFDKLLQLGYDTKRIKKRYKELQTDTNQNLAFEKAWKVQLENNQYEKYTLSEKIKIFLFGPYKMFKSFDIGLKDLYKQNYKIKFRQRLLLLISGTIFWIALMISVFELTEYQRMKEIEKVDISKWEKRMKD